MVANANNKLWESLNAFWKVIESIIGDANPELTAKAVFSKIQQGTHPVHKYDSQFNEITIRTKFNKEALIDKYFAHHITCHIFNYKIPTFLDAAQSITTRIEDQES